MLQRLFSSSSAAAVLSTVFLCLSYAHTLTAQDSPQLFDEPRLLDSRLDLVAPERLDPHRGETVLWGVEQEKEAANIQQQFAELAELLQKVETADDDEQIGAIKKKIAHLAQQEMGRNRRRTANEHSDPYQQPRTASKTETPSEGKVQSAPHGTEQIRALHEAAERLQNSGLKEVAHELRHRAEMMEKEMIVHREHMEQAQKEAQKEKAAHEELVAQNRMIAHKEQLERHRIESDSGPQKQERRLNELSEQVESLHRSVKELNEKLNHILELLKK